MNNSNPFVPQGSLLEQKNKKRARVKVAVFSIFAVNILVISPLLIQGCKEKQQPDVVATAPTNDAPVVDTNPIPPLPAVTNEPPQTAQTNTYTPAPAPAPAPAPMADTGSSHEYVVAKGDSFYTIAAKFGVKMKDIQNANPGVVSTKLKVGQKLQIPASGSSVASGSPAPTSVSEGGETVYVVKSGDSLTKIAKDHGTTIKAIRSANNLKTDKIKVGDKLKIAAHVAAAPAPEPVTPVAAPAPAPVTPAATAAPGR